MLRNLISSSGNSIEIYKIGEEVRRGMLLVKDYSGKVAKKADNIGTEIYFADFDYQPTGHMSDMEISDYIKQVDTIKENSLGLLVKPRVGDIWATDQVDGEFKEGDYAIAKAGKVTTATGGGQSILRFVYEYNDAGHKLYAFEVVEPHKGA